MTQRVRAGLPEPLGTAFMDNGVNIAVFSANATAILLCLFDEADTETARIPLPARTGDVFHGHVAGIRPGQRYGLRAEGPWAPRQGHRFNPAKLLVDPCALRLDRPFALHPAMFGYRHGEDDLSMDDTDSAAFMPKAIMLDDSSAALTLDPPLCPDNTILYELHVRGYTKRHPSVPEALRGTFAGLAQPEVIAHLVRLGISAVELLPCAAWLDERHLPPLGLCNYWGYNPIALCAPDPRLAPGGWSEIAAAVASLHRAGIAVIVDIVFNHCGEGDEYGPTVCFRGLDNASYYRLVPGDERHYVNDTGCGHTLALDRAPLVRLAMDAMRAWVRLGGIDGFRFDLATTLGRRADGFDPDAPLLAAIAQDPLLRGLTMIAEPWDIGPGGYQLGRFPGAWSEWNDRFRDCARRFWRGDGGQLGEMAARFAGSADLFGARHRPPSASVNFITAHDGFTLADLVAYQDKHNQANGEDNRDGNSDNLSCNHGVEGPTDDPVIRARRAAAARALLVSLFTARGMPMLQAGDEWGRTQRGNNNAYCQDNEISWADWAEVDTALLAFTSRLTALRRAHPALSGDRHLTGTAAPGSRLADVRWWRADGDAMDVARWHQGQTLVAELYVEATEDASADHLLVVQHAADAPQAIVLPLLEPDQRWQVLLDSAGESDGRILHGTGPLTIGAKSALVLAAIPAG